MGKNTADDVPFAHNPMKCAKKYCVCTHVSKNIIHCVLYEILFTFDRFNTSISNFIA